MTDPTLTDDYRALLRGVLEDPADDLPRLVLADWLDENGQGERAEFVRVQVEAAAVEPHDHRHREFGGGKGCRRCHLRRRESRLLIANARRWLPGPAGTFEAVVSDGWAYMGRPAALFSRGFISAVTLTQAAFVGESCGCCDRGYVSDGLNSHWCYECDGTGRTPGLAAAMFGTQPITAVALSSCLPFYAGLRYWWHPEGRHVSPGQEACGIARPLFSRLAGNLHSTGDRSYAAAADAHADLSRACVGYGHSLAGLSPLPAGVAVPA